MLPFLFRLAVFISALSVPGAQASSEEAKEELWIDLLDEKLSHFDRYLSYAFSPGYDGSPPLDQDGDLLKPIGLNPEGYDVFSVSEESGTTVLRVSGEYYGSLTTKERYRNYHLQAAFRWGTLVYEPRKNLLKDSGILYHATGNHGDEYWRSWKRSQEFQIMEGHLGDYWSVGGTAIDVRAYPSEYIMSPIASLDRPFIQVGHSQSEKGYVMRRENYEIDNSWNRLDLITYEGRSLHIVNGEVVMVLQNSRYILNEIADSQTPDKDELERPLLEGQIQIQSEAAEIFFKHIKIRELNELPMAYNHLFE